MEYIFGNLFYLVKLILYYIGDKLISFIYYYKEENMKVLFYEFESKGLLFF